MTPVFPRDEKKDSAALGREEEEETEKDRGSFSPSTWIKEIEKQKRQREKRATRGCPRTERNHLAHTPSNGHHNTPFYSKR